LAVQMVLPLTTYHIYDIISYTMVIVSPLEITISTLREGEIFATCNLIRSY
jgi:hypothetical protein